MDKISPEIFSRKSESLFVEFLEVLLNVRKPVKGYVNKLFCSSRQADKRRDATG